MIPGRRLRKWLLLGLGPLLACSPAGERSVHSLGGHRVSFVAPEGWQHFDHGRQQALESDGARIVIVDLGPRPGPDAGGRTLPEWLEHDVRLMDPATHRAIAAHETRSAGNRVAHVVDTWDRLTHEHRRRVVVIPNHGRHLGVAMERGDWTRTRRVLDELVASFEFPEPGPSPSPR